MGAHVLSSSFFLPCLGQNLCDWAALDSEEQKQYTSEDDPCEAISCDLFFSSLARRIEELRRQDEQDCNEALGVPDGPCVTL